MDALTREPVITRPKGRLRRWGVILLCLLATAAIGWAIWFFPAAGPSTKGRDRDAGQPIPVLTSVAATKDVPIYLDGLGTVQAFYTVTMKAMVDGPLLAVNFKEGQDVRKGDVLAQIDPRTYQAALDNAIAKKAQDQAQLANARLDLARLAEAGGEQLYLGTAGRHRESPGRPVRGPGAAGPGADRYRAHPAELHHDHRADRWTDRHPAGRCRATSFMPPMRPALWSSRSCSRFRCCLPCRSRRCRRWRRRWRRAAAPVLALAQDATGGAAKLLDTGIADGAGQSGRSHDRHDQAEGGISQRRAPSVAGRVRQRPPAHRKRPRMRWSCRLRRSSAVRAGRMSS